MENLANPQTYDLLENMMVCPVCMDNFKCSGAKLPKMLPCQHSFCLECLESICTSSKISCPICRRIYATNVERLPQNLLLIQMIDALPTPSEKVELKIQQLSLDDEEDENESISSQLHHETPSASHESNRNYRNADTALELLKSALVKLKQSDYEEYHIDLALDCMRQYRDTGNTPVLENAVECLGYMQLHFMHKIPKFYFKEIANEVLKIFREYDSSPNLKTSCVYVLYTFTNLKYRIFDPIPESINALFEGFDPIEDGGVVEQGTIATIRYLCKKLSQDDMHSVSTTTNIQKLIWILKKRSEDGQYGGTLNATLSILMSLTDAMSARRDFVANHGVSYVALLLQVKSIEKQYVEKGLHIVKKMVVIPSLRSLMIASKEFLSCLKMICSWKDAEYANVVYSAMVIIANVLLIPKSDWGTDEDEYDVLKENLKSYSVTERTDEDRAKIPSTSLQDVMCLAEQEEVEVSRLFAISSMLQLCEGSEGESCSSHISENLGADFIRELDQEDDEDDEDDELDQEDDGVSSELKNISRKLYDLLTRPASDKL